MIDRDPQKGKSKEFAWQSDVIQEMIDRHSTELRAAGLDVLFRDQLTRFADQVASGSRDPQNNDNVIGMKRAAVSEDVLIAGMTTYDHDDEEPDSTGSFPATEEIFLVKADPATGKLDGFSKLEVGELQPGGHPLADPPFTDLHLALLRKQISQHEELGLYISMA